MSGCYRGWLTILLCGTVILGVSGCHDRASDNSKSANAANQNGSPADRAGSSDTTDRGDLKLRYQPRKNANAATAGHIVGSHQQALEALLVQLNQRLSLPYDMYVSFEDCDSPDAYYDPDKHQVTICYQLIDEYYGLFSKKIKDKTKLDDAVRAATASTFFHELGHGLVAAWDIPVTGREEDAVDQLSNLVLIETIENGEEAAMEGALSFKLYADLTKGEAKIYWDEHSLDEQRFFDTICMVYGHDEEKYRYLVKNGTLPEERAAYCAEDYEKVRRAWLKLLGPYLKKAEQPRPKLKVR